MPRAEHPGLSAARTPVDMTITSGTIRDESGTLREGNGRFAPDSHDEPQGVSLARADRNGARIIELENARDAAGDHLNKTNRACIRANNDGWGKPESDRYGDYISLTMDRSQAELDRDRARWDLDIYLLDQARANIAGNGRDRALATLEVALDDGSVSAEGYAEIFALAEEDPQVAMGVLKNWNVKGMLGYSRNHPARYIFLDHESEKVRVAAIKAGASGTAPITLAEVIAAYPTSEVTKAVRYVLSRNGFPGRAAMEDNGIMFGDHYFDKASAYRTYARRKLKPNHRPGKVGPVYPE